MRIRGAVAGSGWLLLAWTICAATYVFSKEGDLHCFGQGLNYQLGDFYDTTNNAPHPVALPRPVKRVATTSRHTLALLEDGSVYSFGSNDYGQLGRMVLLPQPAGEIQATGFNGDVAHLCAGEEHSCLSDGRVVRCFGHRLGAGNDEFYGRPPGHPAMPSPALNLGVNVTKIVSLSCSGYTTCVVLERTLVDEEAESEERVTEIKCWGRSVEGSTGTVEDVKHDEISDLPGLSHPEGKTPTSVAVGGTFTCALFDSGEVGCFGRGAQGQTGRESADSTLGNATLTFSTLVKLPTGRKAISLACGYTHAAAVLDDRSLITWGEGADGRLGVTPGNVGSVPGSMGDNLTVVFPAGSVLDVALGKTHTVVLTTNETLRVFGSCRFGECGNPAYVSGSSSTLELTRSLLAADLDGRTAGQVVAGEYSTCFVEAPNSTAYNRSQTDLPDIESPVEPPRGWRLPRQVIVALAVVFSVMGVVGLVATLIWTSKKRRIARAELKAMREATMANAAVTALTSQHVLANTSRHVAANPEFVHASNHEQEP